jgi:hypothetical protein
VAAIGAQAAANGQGAVAKLDIAGFKFKTPADASDGNSRGLSWYFGYLGVNAAFDNKTQTGAIAGALAEVVATINTILLWYNRDGVQGFQWNLASGVDVFDCTPAGSTYDCVDPNGIIDVKDLAWSPISRTEQACTVVAPAGDYEADCKVVTFQTSGAMNSMPSTPVITLTSRTVSQPMLINTILHGPDHAKIDVTIAFPWTAANFTSGLYNATEAQVALIGVQAGKAVAAGAVAIVDSSAGEKKVKFTAAGGKHAFFSYTETATIGAVSSSPIVTKVLTAVDVKTFTCAAGTPCSNVASKTFGVMALLKLGMAWLEGFGWIPQVTIHSFTVKNPVSIYWDPTIGAESLAGKSSSFVLVPSAILALFLALIVA